MESNASQESLILLQLPSDNKHSLSVGCRSDFLDTAEWCESLQ